MSLHPKKKKNEKGRKKRKGEKCEFPNTFENLRNWTLEKGLEKTKTMLRKMIFFVFDFIMKNKKKVKYN